MKQPVSLHDCSPIPAAAHAARIASGSDLFRNVSTSVLQRVFERCPILELAAGESLPAPGAHGECLYLVLEGRLQAPQHRDRASDRLDLAAGALIGEMSVIDGFDPSTRVTAVSEARVLRMDTRCLWSLVAASHEAAANLFAILSRRIGGRRRAPAGFRAAQPVPPTVSASMRSVG